MDDETTTPLAADLATLTAAYLRRATAHALGDLSVLSHADARRELALGLEMLAAVEWCRDALDDPEESDDEARALAEDEAIMAQVSDVHRLLHLAVARLEAEVRVRKDEIKARELVLREREADLRSRELDLRADELAVEQQKHQAMVAFMQHQERMGEVIERDQMVHAAGGQKIGRS